MKNKKQRFSDLFYDNRFVLVFSLIAAVVIWLVVVVEFSPEITHTVKGVPVQIDYSKIEKDLGLKPFGETQFTVDVTISGKRYIVESDDTVNDIVVTADTSYVNSVGTYRLNLKVSTVSPRPGYNFNNLSTDEVEVYFDYQKEKEFAIEADIEFKGDATPDGYFIDSYIFPESNIVRVSGPETEINKISRVVARGTVEETLRQNDTIDASLVALTKEGSVPKFISFNKQSEVIRITIPVYKIAELPVECSFINKPSNYVDNLPFKVSISPATARFGIPEQKLEGLEAFEIASIDFSKIHSGINEFTVNASDITGAVVLDDVEQFTVTVTVDGMASKTIAAPESVNFINVPGNVNVDLVKLDFSEITIVGPEESISQLNTDNIIISADLNGIDEKTVGNATVTVMVTDDDCWSYGDYTATVNIS